MIIYTMPIIIIAPIIFIIIIESIILIYYPLIRLIFTQFVVAYALIIYAIQFIFQLT